MKFTPYTAAEDVLLRDRLMASALHALPEAARSTLLIAPAGYGKTTLLCHIRQAMQTQNAIAVWLNCTVEDRDPDVFLTNLSHAFRAVGLLDTVIECGVGDLMEILAENGLTALMLDEYENAASEGSHSVLENIIRALPPAARLFVACRELPKISLAKLRLDGRVRIVDAAELRFTDQEMASVLPAAALPAGYANLLQQSEGWPVMVQLARLNWQNSGELSPSATPRLGQAIGIFDYLAEQILNYMPTPLRDFLLEISVLSEVDIPSAQVVTTCPDAEKAMYGLLRLRPIVTVISENPLAIRLHPLFRDFLRHESLNYPVTAASELHRRASHFYAAQKDMPNAMHHAAQSGSEDLIVQILEDAGGALLNISEGYSRMRSYLSMLPPATILRRPQLHLARIMQQAMEGTSADWLDEFDRFMSQIDGPIGQTLDWDADLRLIIELIRVIGEVSECRYACNDADWPGVDDRRRKCIARKFEEPRYYALALLLELIFTVEYGSLQLADQRAEEVAELFHSANFSPNLFWISNHQSNVNLNEGNLAAAEYHSKLCLERIRNSGETRNTLIRQHCYAILGQCAYEQNKLEEALALFNEIPKNEPYSLLRTATASVCTAARAQMLVGDGQRALADLRQAYDFACAESLPHLKPVVAATLAESSLLMEDAEGCLHWIAEADLEKMLAKSQLWFNRPWLETEALVRLFTRYWLHQGEIDRAHDVAHEFAVRARQSGRMLVAAHADVMVMESLLRKGCRNQAQVALRRALDATAEHGALRTLLDMSPEGGTLLRGLVRRKDQPQKAWIDAILNAMESGVISQTTTATDISARERDVLCGLSLGQPAKVIARDLDISHETVRHHLKRVYAKLDVHNRDEAIEEARRRGIIT